MVTRIQFGDGRAMGVACHHGGEEVILRAHREIILAAGETALRTAVDAERHAERTASDAREARAAAEGFWGADIILPC